MLDCKQEGVHTHQHTHAGAFGVSQGSEQGSGVVKPHCGELPAGQRARVGLVQAPVSRDYFRSFAFKPEATIR